MRLFAALRAKRFYLFIFLSFFLTTFSVAAKLNDVVQKSPYDQRVYDELTLANGLKVLVVSDNNAKNTACAMVVHAGSYDEPSQHLGLAHYLEHMLFLGTKKYPKPDEFQQFVSQFGGSYNATTQGEKTSFFFHIQPDALEPALARFSDFFIAPLFNVELMDRELNSVDAEFQLNINQDTFALHEVNRQTSNPEHPFSRFSAGNHQTLNQKDKLYAAVKDFYKTYYHAHNMTLVLVGPQSKAELKQYAQQFFADIPAGTEIKRQRPMVFEAQHLGLDIHMRSLSQAKELLIQFYVPSQRSLYKEKPGQIISMLLGYEGKGSLAYELKKRGWISGLMSQFGTVATEQDEILINCSLTDAGLKHTDDITEMVFAYINLLKKQGIPAHFFNEVKTMSDWNFQFTQHDEPIDYALNLAEMMLDVPAQDLITSGYYLKSQALPANEIKQLLSYLQPRYMRRVLLTPNADTDQITPWYQAAYRKKKLNAHMLKIFGNPKIAADFKLPEPNPFLPEKLAILQQASDVQTQPIKLESDGMTLWYQQNSEYNVPRTNIMIHIEQPLPFATPEQTLLSQLLIQHIEQRLQEKLYAVIFAGATVSLQNHPRGLTLSLSSYSDKQDILLQQVLATMRQITITPAQFEQLRNEEVQSLESQDHQALYQKALLDLNTLIYAPSWHAQELVQAAKKIKYEQLQAALKQMWEAQHIELLVHGNINKKTALELTKTLKPFFPEAKSSAGQPSPVKIVKLAQDKTWYHPMPKHDENQVLVWYLQHPTADYPTMAKMVLLSKLLESPYFQHLRVEKQLGYALQVSPYVMNRVSGMLFWIQSTQADPKQLHAEIKTFLQRYRFAMNQMSEEDIASFKFAIVSQLRQSPQTLDEETQRYWAPIQRGDYEFDRAQALSEAVEKLTLPELLTFTDELFFKSNRSGQLLLVTAHHSMIPKDQIVPSMSSLKSQLGYFS